ncbi:MAG: hypothetical protein K0R76_55 [Alphaproteobacteria bacterium]|jgi:hypothetical protein|nr:hypothetical protein [Alphaproteobacteria bacterium]
MRAWVFLKWNASSRNLETLGEALQALGFLNIRDPSLLLAIMSFKLRLPNFQPLTMDPGY